MASNIATPEHEQQQERSAAKKTELVREYGRVGPAAINAALLYKPKARKDAPRRIWDQQEET